jgi:hypothetical protein
MHILFFAGKLHPEIALQFIIFAPLMPFLMLFTMISDKIKQIRYQLRERKMRSVSSWIAISLAEKGIEVIGNYGPPIPYTIEDTHGTHTGYLANGYDSLHDRCEVHAVVSPEQITDYQSVYAQALRRFKKLTPAQICGNAKPPEPLDQKWAESIGIKEYFALEHFAPCAICGIQLSWGMVWGDQQSHLYLHWSDAVNTYHFKDKLDRTIKGYVCNNCVRALNPYSGGTYFE